MVSVLSLQFVVSEDSNSAAAAKPEINNTLEVYGISLGLTKESQKVHSILRQSKTNFDSKDIMFEKTVKVCWVEKKFQ